MADVTGRLAALMVDGKVGTMVGSWVELSACSMGCALGWIFG